MGTIKTFDNADLLKFFADFGVPATAGYLTVIVPNLTLFGETETKRYPVEAKTEALWCEKYALAFVVQSISFPDGGRGYLPEDHPLRQDPTVHHRYGSGGGSGALVRWAMELADNWRDAVKWWMPTGFIDLTSKVMVQAESDLADPGVVDDDHTPTGTSIDDPFEDGEAQA